MMKGIFTLCIFLSTTAVLQAQVLNTIKRKVEERAKKLTSRENLEKKAGNLAASEMDEAKAEFDSTDFDYAILLSDYSGLFDVKEKGELTSKFATWRGLAASYSRNDELTDTEKARLNLEMGEIAYASGRYTYAEKRFNSARDLYEMSGLTEEVGYLKVLANQGLLYATMGRFSQAEEPSEQALSLRRQILGEGNTGVASSLNNYGVLKCNLARYSEAENDFIEAIRILEQNQLQQSMPYAIALNNQAMLNQTVGRFEDAVAGLQKAISIAEKLQSKKSKNHLKFISNLALLYQQMGRLSDAETLYLSMEKRLGRNDPDYASMLTNLAALYISSGKFSQAEESLVKSAGIFKSSFSEESPAFARATCDLGNLYRIQQRYADAEPLLNKALSVRERTLGKNHPVYVQNQEDLAILFWKKSEWDAAYMTYREVMAKSTDFIRNYFPPMSEAEKTKYWDVLAPRFQRFVNFASECHLENKHVLVDLFEYQMETKALLLNTTNRIRQSILGSGDASLITDYNHWLDQKERLSRLYAYTREELLDQNINLDSLERTANALERSLSDRSEDFSSGYTSTPVTYGQLAQLLGDGDVLVEMIRMKRYDQKFSDEVAYVAMVVMRGDEVPSVVMMDKGSLLETRFAKYYKNAILQQVEDEISYEQFWRWIAPLLKQKKFIYFSPDGVYNQINLNTLREPGQPYFVQRYDLVQIGNPKDLITAKRKPQAGRKSATLVGFPDYGGAAIPPLPGTKTEIEGVSRVLKSAGYEVSLFTQSTASESSIKKVAGPGLLHVATHGYFLADVERAGQSAFGVQMENAGDNPLLRSGLLFSGAAKTASGELPDLNSNDNGVLTAYEAMNLDLRDTELVILSACETGLGEVKAGEGVYGLQRAFHAAGADAIIMSLWKVDDAATQMLMNNFYAQWLKLRDKQKAFKQAQISLMARYKEPYYWGAFVMMGM